MGKELKKQTDLLMQILINDDFKLREDEYFKNNIIYCKNCNTSRMYVSDDGKFKTRCICECQRDKIEEKHKQDILIEQQLKYKQLQELSLLGKRYIDVTFANTDLNRNNSFLIAFQRCKKYCENSEYILQNGLGMYLWGESGVGKTHLTACMINELLKKNIPCLLTNFSEISKMLRSFFNKYQNNENDYINKLATIPFLFIDDFGTERVQKDGEDNWLQEKIYDIINKRYNEQKPTIFSSNLSVQDLIEKQGMMKKTVDRVVELSSAIIKIDGDTSYRLKKRNVAIPF